MGRAPATPGSATPTVAALTRYRPEVRCELYGVEQLAGAG